MFASEHHDCHPADRYIHTFSLRRWSSLYVLACRVAAGVKKALVQNEEDNPAFVDHGLDMAKLQVQKALAAGSGNVDTSLERDVAYASTSAGSKVNLATAWSGERRRSAQLANEIWRKCHERRHFKMGGSPPPREEGTRKQLAALHSLFASPVPPYADFATVSPCGNRVERTVQLILFVLRSGSALQPMVSMGLGYFVLFVLK